MIIKNDSYSNQTYYPSAPLPMATYEGNCSCVPFVCVNSINGLTGDVVLKALIVGDKYYNGSSGIEIKAEDLGLESALKYIGERTEQQIYELEAEIGDLYYCKTNDFYYLFVGEKGWKKLPSDKIVEASQADISKLQKDLQILRIEFDNLSDLARSGNVNDLLQDDGDVLILDCSVKIQGA